MREYFANVNNQIRLNHIIASWIGAPYHHMGYTRGGVDCTKFVGLVCLELGILWDMERDIYYGRDWYIHGQHEVVLESFDRHIAAFLQPGLHISKFVYTKQPLINGDVVCIATHAKGLCNHTGIFLDPNRMAHCLEFKGIFICDFGQWGPNVKFFYRLYEG